MYKPTPVVRSDLPYGRLTKVEHVMLRVMFDRTMLVSINAKSYCCSEGQPMRIGDVLHISRAQRGLTGEGPYGPAFVRILGLRFYRYPINPWLKLTDSSGEYCIDHAPPLSTVGAWSVEHGRTGKSLSAWVDISANPPRYDSKNLRKQSHHRQIIRTDKMDLVNYWDEFPKLKQYAATYQARRAGYAEKCTR